MVDSVTSIHRFEGLPPHRFKLDSMLSNSPGQRRHEAERLTAVVMGLPAYDQSADSLRAVFRVHLKQLLHLTRLFDNGNKLFGCDVMLIVVAPADKAFGAAWLIVGKAYLWLVIELESIFSQCLKTCCFSAT